MRFWGLVDLSVLEAIELFASRQAAEQTLGEVLADEPDWDEILLVAPIEIGNEISLS